MRLLFVVLSLLLSTQAVKIQHDHKSLSSLLQKTKPLLSSPSLTKDRTPVVTDTDFDQHVRSVLAKPTHLSTFESDLIKTTVKLCDEHKTTSETFAKRDVTVLQTHIKYHEKEMNLLTNDIEKSSLSKKIKNEENALRVAKSTSTVISSLKQCPSEKTLFSLIEADQQQSLANIQTCQLFYDRGFSVASHAHLDDFLASKSLAISTELFNEWQLCLCEPDTTYTHTLKCSQLHERLSVNVNKCKSSVLASAASTATRVEYSQVLKNKQCKLPVLDQVIFDTKTKKLTESDCDLLSKPKWTLAECTQHQAAKFPRAYRR